MTSFEPLSPSPSGNSAPGTPLPVPAFIQVRRYWTLPEMARLRDRYPFATRTELAREFDRTASAIHNMATKLGLSKTENAGCFKPGHKTWNAGKHYNAGGRSKLTQFRKGGPRPRDRAIGDERIERDGIYVKVAARGRWVRKERLQWEREHGPIPEGMVLRTDPLRLVTRAENVRLNWRPRGPAKRKLAAWIPLVAA